MIYQIQINENKYKNKIKKENYLIKFLNNYCYKEESLDFSYLFGFNINKIKINENYGYLINKEKKDKVILYLHGGALILPLSNNNLITSKLLYKYTSTDIFMLDYSVKKYPHPFNDVLFSYKYLLKSYKEIYIVGSSAGGNLACGLLNYIKDYNLKRPKGTVLISPWLDLTCSLDSYKYNIENDLLFSSLNHDLIPNKYTDTFDKYNLPLLNNDFNDFSIISFVSDNELVLSDSKELEKRCKNMKLYIYKNMYHEFFKTDDYQEECKYAWLKIQEFIK